MANMALERNRMPQGTITVRRITSYPNETTSSNAADRATKGHEVQNIRICFRKKKKVKDKQIISKIYANYKQNICKL